MKEAPYTLINQKLYKLVQDDICHQGMLPKECESIIDEAHVGAIEGNFQVYTTVKKILQAGLCWPTLNRDCKS